MNGHALKELAHAICIVAHDGQSRMGAGEPYHLHPERVADSLWGWRAKTLAYLHDVIEDTDHPDDMTTALYVLFPADIVLDLLALSRLPNPKDGTKISYEAFITNVLSRNEDVRRVKLADVDDNLQDIEDIPGAQNLKLRYLKAKARLEESLAEGS